MPRKRIPPFVAATAILVATLACNFVAATPQQTTSFPTEDPYIEVPRVPLEEAKAAFDTGAAIFVDVRGDAAYTQSHIPGALSIPGTVLESRMNELDKDQWIITYCT